MTKCPNKLESTTPNLQARAIQFRRQASSDRAVVASAAALVILLWASSFVAVKASLRELSPSQVALGRYFVAAVVFFALQIFRRSPMPRRKDLARMAACGWFGIALYNLVLNRGQQTVGAGVASMMVATAPLWTALLSAVTLGERVGIRQWLGALVSFAGVALISLDLGGWSGLSPGSLLILVAALSQAVYFVLCKPLLKRYHPLDLTSYVIWFGLVFLLPFHDGLIAELAHCSTATVGNLLFLGIGPAALAYAAWSYVLQRLPASRAANLLFTIPVIALALGWLFLHEVPSLMALLGGGLALLGVGYGRSEARR